MGALVKGGEQRNAKRGRENFRNIKKLIPHILF